MVQPIQYVTPGAFDPFNSLMQGVRLGATFEEMQAARQQREMQQQQMLMQQDMVRAQQQALQQKAMQEQARQEELARLQAIPYEQMTKEQALRMMDLTQSEATRAHIARRLEAIPAEKRQTLARDYGSTTIALIMNPEIGVRRLRESAQVQTDPAEKKALEDAVRIAELDPTLAARTIHGMMHMSQDPGMVKIAESATKYLETAGKPLYPKQAEPPKTPATIVSTDADKVRLGLVENGKPLPGVWAIEPGKAPQQLKPEVARAAGGGGAGGGGGGAPAQPREPSAPTVTEIEDPAQPGRMIKIDAKRYQPGGTIGSPGVIGTSGKTTKVAEADQKKMEGNAQLQTILDTLRYSYDRLDELRGIPSENRNFMSNAWNWLATTSAGQVAGRMGGTKEQTERDVIQSSRNLLFTAVKNATGKTTGELNSNVEFRTWLDALTDPSRSIESNRTILENIEKFVASGGNYSARSQGGRVTSTGTARPTAPSQPAPQTAAPATVTLPDGRTVTFPNQAAADQFRRAAGL